jgi:hypothetical protein
LEGSVHHKKKNAEAIVVASKQTGPEVNSDKTKYMVFGTQVRGFKPERSRRIFQGEKNP